MKRISCDCYEFDTSSSEEFLEMAIATIKEHPDMRLFRDACGASTEAGREVDHAYWNRWAGVVAYVKRFADFDLPSIDRCKVTVMSDSWDELEFVALVGHRRVWYRWYTTA